MPPRIAALPRDSRGYPIPWNVLRDREGVPHFAMNDLRKHLQAAVERLCPICGGRLGKFIWFVGGPVSAFHPDGSYFDLPGHCDCIEFSLRVCPYMATPHYSREKPLLERVKIPPGVLAKDPTQEEWRGRPEVFVAASCHGYSIRPNPDSDLPFLVPDRPFLEYRYWRHGQRLSDAEGEELVRRVTSLRALFGAGRSLLK